MCEVKQLHPVKKGDIAFMHCSCKPGGTEYAILAIADDDAPIICSLLCPECETELPVVNGIVHPAE